METADTTHLNDMTIKIVVVCLQPTVHVHNVTETINHICPFQGDFHLLFLPDIFMMSGVENGAGLSWQNTLRHLLCSESS